MDTPQEILRERELRYQRLLRLIKGYNRSKQQVKEMEEMKRETVFEITLRFKRSEINKSYVFPRRLSPTSSDNQLNEEELQLSSRRDIFYNLNKQAIVTNEDTKPKRSTIQRMETELVVTDKAKQLQNPIRPLLNRIDVRIEKLLTKELPKRARQLTERAERSPTEHSSHISLKKMAILEFNLPKRMQEHSDQLPVSARANNNYNIRTDRSIPLIPLHRKIISQQVSPLANQKRLDRLITQQPHLRRQKSIKKIHTQQASPPHPPILKLKIQTKLQTNKIDIVASGLLSSNLKQKNLFQKQAF